MGALVLNNLEDVRMGIQFFPLIEVEKTASELPRSVTHGKDVSTNREWNEEDNTNVIDNKLNDSTKETMASVDTNATVLELSKSATSTKDVSNDNNEDNNAKLKERDNTNDIENKNNNGAKKSMASIIALT